MKYAKKIIAITVLAVIISLPFTPQTTYARENSNTGIIELQPNTSVEGQQQGDTIYSFTMPGKGYVRFQLKNKEYSGQLIGIHLYLYCKISASGDLSQEIDQSYWNKIDPFDETQNTACLNFSAGTTIYLKVSDSESMEEQGRGIKYELTADYYPNSSWESEPNDDIAHATPLAIGKARHGTGYYSYDQDFYSFIATKNGTIKCSLSIADAEKIRQYDDYYSLKNTSDFISIEILNKAGKKLASNYNQSKNMSISFKVQKGKKYFVHVSPPRYYGIDALYKIRVAYKK